MQLAILRDATELAVPHGGGNVYRPAQLPADLSTFTGRLEELTELVTVSKPGGEGARNVVISALDGMAGVGKTALAVHAAHRLAADFPDGQLFVDLHGFSENVKPVEPADALDRMLRALDVPGPDIPAEVDDRAALLRTRLCGRRMVIVLDNAVAEDQVLPLLPGTPGCIVLITSRRRLNGLVDARSLSLDVLTSAEAVALFQAIAGRDLSHESGLGLVHEVVAACGRLPLAIHIAAARLRSRPAWALTDLIERLRPRDGLSELDAGSSSVAAAFDLSYQQLTPLRQRVFRLLALIPGADLDDYACAALAAVPSSEARRVLEDLVDAHLLVSDRPGRYRFHDLIRRYASIVATRDEPEPSRRKALTRLLDSYVYTACVAANELFPHDISQRPRLSTPDSPIPTFDGPDPAGRWLDTERANLIAAAIYAVDHGWPEHTSRLSQLLQQYLDMRSQSGDAHALHQHALRAAHCLGDKSLAARVLNNLSGSCWRFGRYTEAFGYLRQALVLQHETGDRSGQASTLTNLGIICERLGRCVEALGYLAQAADLQERLGYGLGQARVQNNLAIVYRRLDRYAESVEHAERALALYNRADNAMGMACALGNLGLVLIEWDRCSEALKHFERARALFVKVGNKTGEAETLNSLGAVQLRLGHDEAALAHHRDALNLAQRIGDRHQEARAHEGQATIHHELGSLDEARGHWREALSIYTALQVPEAGQLRAKLSACGAGHTSPGTCCCSRCLISLPDASRDSRGGG